MSAISGAGAACIPWSCARWTCANCGYTGWLYDYELPQPGCCVLCEACGIPMTRVYSPVQCDGYLLQVVES